MWNIDRGLWLGFPLLKGAGWIGFGFWSCEACPIATDHWMKLWYISQNELVLPGRAKACVRQCEH
jgi:hypothetical protein